MYTGAAIYIGGFVILTRRTEMSSASASLVAAAIALAFLVGCAAWYWVTVKSITGTWKRAWSLPEAATLTFDGDPARSLQRVLTLARDAFPWLLWTSTNETLTLNRKGWWGNASVQIDATAIDDGTQLRFRVGPVKLVNNLIGRAMIGRLLAEIASEPEWTHQ
jgi:hypothetical protein